MYALKISRLNAVYSILTLHAECRVFCNADCLCVEKHSHKWVFFAYFKIPRNLAKVAESCGQGIGLDKYQKWYLIQRTPFVNLISAS